MQATRPLVPGPRRTLARGKADENATARHVRQPSAGASRIPTKDRATLGEVTATSVNLRKPADKSEKTDTENALKRGRTGSIALASRVPLGPSRSQPAPAATTGVTAPRTSLARPQPPKIPVLANVDRRALVRPKVYVDEEEVKEQRFPPPVLEIDMDASDDSIELKDMQVVVEDVELIDEEPPKSDFDIAEKEEPERTTESQAKHSSWPSAPTAVRKRAQQEVEAIKELYEDEETDLCDPTMVSEYANEIFDYMKELELTVMPAPDYMSSQSDLNWDTREMLVDWIIQVHLRYHLLPETLWIAINIVDRFLSRRVVSLVKLQLVGVTAVFIAAKYEEILAPSVQEFIYMTEATYTKEEIFKGERIVLQTIDFNVSQYCSPYSWMRKISKADDYDLQTRTLSKFLTEVTLLDYRFLAAPPHLVAAVGMYSARIMLGGDWNDKFIYHSEFTEEQLQPGHNMLVKKLTEDNFAKAYVCRKYANKKFLKASTFAIDWAKVHVAGDGAVEVMTLDD